MAKLIKNRYLIFILLLCLTSCSINVQNLTKDKCLKTIKDINQTVFNSDIEKIFFGQFSTSNYKKY